MCMNYMHGGAEGNSCLTFKWMITEILKEDSFVLVSTFLLLIEMPH